MFKFTFRRYIFCIFCSLCALKPPQVVGSHVTWHGNLLFWIIRIIKMGQMAPEWAEEKLGQGTSCGVKTKQDKRFSRLDRQKLTKLHLDWRSSEHWASSGVTSGVNALRNTLSSGGQWDFIFLICTITSSRSSVRPCPSRNHSRKVGQASNNNWNWFLFKL